MMEQMFASGGSYARRGKRVGVTHFHRVSGVEYWIGRVLVFVGPLWIKGLCLSICAELLLFRLLSPCN